MSAYSSTRSNTVWSVASVTTGSPVSSLTFARILSPSSPFVMNVQTVKTWRNNFDTPFANFKDDEIRKLYDTVISLKHDADFLEQLQNKDEFLYYYFISKVPFIERNRDFFDPAPHIQLFCG